MIRYVASENLNILDAKKIVDKKDKISYLFLSRFFINLFSPTRSIALPAHISLIVHAGQTHSILA